MKELSNTITRQLEVRAPQEDNQNLRAPWDKLLKFLTTPKVYVLYGGSLTVEDRTRGPGSISSHFRLSPYGGSLNMCWPRNAEIGTIATIMGGSKATEKPSRRIQHNYHADPESDHPKRIHHEVQKGREIPEAVDDMRRQDYQDLLLKYDGMKETSAAQEQEIAFLRKHISETSSNDEMNRCMDEVQAQLLQISTSIDWFTSEHYKIIDENNKRSQHKFSMRNNLDRLSRALLTVTEENKALKAGPRMDADKLAESENDEFESTAESEEQVRSGTSTLHRKKATSNLRSREVEKCASQFKSSYEQLMHNQDRPTDELLKEMSATRAELLTLQSELKSAQTHIINIGGNLGALLPQETVKKVRTIKNSDRVGTDPVTMDLGVQFPRHGHTDLGHNLHAAVNQQF